MSTAISVSEVQIDSCVYPPTVKPPGSKQTLFLAGAGVRGLVIEGKFVKFTTNGLHLEESAIPWLADKWKGKTADELMDSDEFFREIVTGPFEKLTWGRFILPLTGKQYAEKVTENCTAIIKELGAYGDAEAKAIEKFREVFRDESFPPGASVFYTQFPNGSLMISFSKDSTVPETGHAVIENKPLSEAVLESIVGKGGVSPAGRKNIAERLSELLKDSTSGPADSKVIQQTQGVSADSEITQQTQTQGVGVKTP